MLKKWIIKLIFLKMKIIKCGARVVKITNDNHCVNSKATETDICVRALYCTHKGFCVGSIAYELADKVSKLRVDKLPAHYGPITLVAADFASV